MPAVIKRGIQCLKVFQKYHAVNPVFLYVICRSGSVQTMTCLLAALNDISKCQNTETMRTPLHEVAFRKGESIKD